MYPMAIKDPPPNASKKTPRPAPKKSGARLSTVNATSKTSPKHNTANATSRQSVAKLPSMSQNPSKRVGKNVLGLARATSHHEELANTGLAQAFESVILTMSAPENFEAVRLGSVAGSYETAVANPFGVYQAYWNSLTSSNGFLFRDPCRFFVYYYDLAGATGNSNYSFSYANLPLKIANSSNGGDPMPGYPLPWSSGVQTHGPKLYPGRRTDSFRSYYYLANGYIAVTNATNPSTAIGGSLWFLGENGSETRIDTQPTAIAAGGILQWSITAPGYYAIDLATAGTCAFGGTYTVSQQTGPGFFTYAHRAIPDLETKAATAQAIKIVGASLMFTNDAGPLNRQGKLAALQVAQGRDWRNYLTYDSLIASKKNYTNTAVNGYYGFLKPTEEHDVRFITNQSPANVGGSNAWFNLDTPSDFLAFNVMVTDPDGRDGRYRIATSMEYRTEDRWIDVEEPVIPFTVVQSAMSCACKMPQHHENPLHMEDILNFVKDVGRRLYTGLTDAVPKVIEVASKIATVGAAIMPFLV